MDAYICQQDASKDTKFCGYANFHPRGADRSKLTLVGSRASFVR